MGKAGYTDELGRALARPDVDTLIRQIDAYRDHIANGDNEWPDEHAEDFEEILFGAARDSEKALAYVVIAASRTDDEEFLRLLGCGPLEDLLYRPSAELLERVVAEGRKSPRFRWLLSCPFQIAVSENAWSKIEPFRLTAPNEEPPLGSLPPQ